MQSRWSYLKEEAVALRQLGMSMTVIEKKLGIPRSTLSLWFKKVPITEKQRLSLMKNRQDGWAKARVRAVESHRAQKALRLVQAKKQAQSTIAKMAVTPELLELTFAMLYWGEGTKGDKTSIGSSDPNILRFAIYVLRTVYQVPLRSIRCDLHLRMDQDPEETRRFWADSLQLPTECFRKPLYDKRSVGRPTYSHYHGVCVIDCANVAIQRKLMYLYTLFSEQVTQGLDTGA